MIFDKSGKDSPQGKGDTGRTGYEKEVVECLLTDVSYNFVNHLWLEGKFSRFS